MGYFDVDPGHDIDDRLWIQGCVVVISVVLLVLVTNEAPDWLGWATLFLGFGIVGVLLRRRDRRR